MPPDHLDRFLSWSRYLYWADLLYQRWMEPTEDQETLDPALADWRRFALAAQWLASVWVVVEGWRQLRLSDAVVDRLLAAYPDYCDLLRRFRNGVYHFQPELFDERLRAFPTNGEETLFWVLALFYEFKRFFWEWPDKHPGTVSDKEALRSEVYRAVGWMPADILHARLSQVRKLQQEAERMLSEAGDYSTREAVALLDAIKEFESTAGGLEKSPLLNLLTRLNPRH